ncbi:MAG: hypothetical protein ACQEW5_26100 [Bacillota bacterium]
MDRSTLLTKMKEASPDGVSFTLILNANSVHEQKQIISTAKWLQSEMYIRLKTCEVQKVMLTEGVVLSGTLDV